MKEQAGKDERVPLLVQISGIGYITALTILAAIGDINRFPSAKQLVGYAGLGARVHDSGVSHTTGRITKTGRRDLRRAMVDSANQAVRHHPHWIEDYEKRRRAPGTIQDRGGRGQEAAGGGLVRVDQRTGRSSSPIRPRWPARCSNWRTRSTSANLPDGQSRARVHPEPARPAGDRPGGDQRSPGDRRSSSCHPVVRRVSLSGF